ncbi:MAG: bifunctional (p)ppGpp synthetase/guanosine-3',5'-bis(diphosphate) 3'-pyrophosphohydrolase [Betaproteobacteria bacterium]|nr:bifunctional (p)ppGpp synthetase/guanosine-3',5'-bis(diphosphate) 3'-pyrophosphohydrolase [Betaproteobacteria bacterium]
MTAFAKAERRTPDHDEVDPEAVFRDFVERCGGYLKPTDRELLTHAFDCARDAHSGQYRASGEPYITHPIAVAEVLTQWHLDAHALSAALLHDVVEDTGVDIAEIGSRFGDKVAHLVEGVSKLDRMHFASREQAQAENFRKMLLAMSRDVRVILIKLADRLHNMRTLGAVKAEKARRVAGETLEIYAPIARRLGLARLVDELEDLSFRHLYPDRHRVLENELGKMRGRRREILQRLAEDVGARLREYGVEGEVKGREKTLYSIYRKMAEKHLSFSQVMDIYGLRVVVRDQPNCYLALGALHSLYKPIHGKFKDYIAIPKANGYQSLHTTLFGPYGNPVEMQIRTYEMHRFAETGVASHWLYRKPESALSDIQLSTTRWLQTLIEAQADSPDAGEFLEQLKVDLFPGEVYVFTPGGKILALPRGATVVDFAYAVHTDIGDRCIAARVNDQLAPLRTELRNGDRVEVVTAPNASPNPRWLSFVVSGKARHQIRHFLRTLRFEESVMLGERLLDQALHAFHHHIGDVGARQWQQLAHQMHLAGRDELLVEIGTGKRQALEVARSLLRIEEADGSVHGLGAITVQGSEAGAIEYASCCQPVPGDPIIGLIDRGRGLVIHTHDCPAVRRKRRRTEASRWVDVEWDAHMEGLFPVTIRVVSAHKPGVLAELAKAIAEAESNISGVSVDEADTGSAYTTVRFTIEVANRVQLAHVMRNLRKLPEVVRLARTRSGSS